MTVHQDLAGEIVDVVHGAHHRHVRTAVTNARRRPRGNAVLGVQQRGVEPGQRDSEPVDAAGDLVLQRAVAGRSGDDRHRCGDRPEETGGRVAKRKHVHNRAGGVQRLGERERVHHSAARLRGVGDEQHVSGGHSPAAASSGLRRASAPAA